MVRKSPQRIIRSGLLLGTLEYEWMSTRYTCITFTSLVPCIRRCTQSLMVLNRNGSLRWVPVWSNTRIQTTLFSVNCAVEFPQSTEYLIQVCQVSSYRCKLSLWQWCDPWLEGLPRSPQPKLRWPCPEIFPFPPPPPKHCVGRISIERCTRRCPPSASWKKGRFRI